MAELVHRLAAELVRIHERWSDSIEKAIESGEPWIEPGEGLWVDMARAAIAIVEDVSRPTITVHDDPLAVIGWSTGSYVLPPPAEDIIRDVIAAHDGDEDAAGRLGLDEMDMPERWTYCCAYGEGQLCCLDAEHPIGAALRKAIQ